MNDKLLDKACLAFKMLAKTMSIDNGLSETYE